MGVAMLNAVTILLTLLDETHRHPTVVPCSATRAEHCCGDGRCDTRIEDENNCLADCPGVITAITCGEEPHSDRGGKTLTFGAGHRAKSAQDCCDKCVAHKSCNS